MTRKKII